MRKSGSLVVAWNDEQLSKLPGVLAENVEAGDREARLLDRAELRALEPALGEGAVGAVLCPREAVVEPWLVPMGYAESARLHGALLVMGTEAVAAWRAPLAASLAASDPPGPLAARIEAAGAAVAAEARPSV